MKRKESPTPLTVVWELTPDPDFAEKLRKVFEIIFGDGALLEDGNALDENLLRGKDESQGPHLMEASK
jgi:hypothetical protein